MEESRGAWLRNYHIADAYFRAEGVHKDMQKCIHYHEIATMMGAVDSRHNLGCNEMYSRNVHLSDLSRAENHMNRAVKHYMIAASAGCEDSLTMIQKMYQEDPGVNVTKEDFASALRDFGKICDEMKS